jgi:protein-S-isoprenylcysteine O-methyltransferase Ste14
MELLPELKLGWLNGWLPLVILYGAFGILLIIFPREVVSRLYDRSGWTQRDYMRRLFGLVIMLTWFALTILSPLKSDHVVFWVGLVIYALSSAGFVVALINYRNTPGDRPVTQGLYRYSRHPQIVTLLLAFLGISVATGSWTAVLLLIVSAPLMHTRVLSEERACLEQYGSAY